MKKLMKIKRDFDIVVYVDFRYENPMDEKQGYGASSMVVTWRFATDPYFGNGMEVLKVIR